ncbi:MAG: transcriptional regulator [Bacteroidia bacterium]
MLEGFDKTFENKVRLGIMAALMTNDRLDFIELRSLLKVTDGNLASHLSNLESLEYVAIHKTFVGKKPNTSIKLTKLGRKAFEKHIKFLEKLLKR